MTGVFDSVFEGKLETDVYRKPTHTDKYLSYDSHHPVSHKRSVGKTLLQRAESLPSNSDSQAMNVNMF